MRKQLCIFCKHICISPANPDYSDMTPGNDVEVYCLGKGHWHLDGYESTTAAYRENMLKAVSCEDYGVVDDPNVKAYLEMEEI